MSEILLPKFGEPTVTEEARDYLLSSILADGIEAVFEHCKYLFDTKYPVLNNQIFYSKILEIPGIPNDYKSTKAFNIGKVISARAYQLSGYEQSIELETIAAAAMDAELDGVPQIYQCCAMEDAELQNLITTIAEIPDLSISPIRSCQSSISLGSGVTRHFIKSAIVV